MLKVTIISFLRHNAWGSIDQTTHYYVGGRCVSKNAYYGGYCSSTDMEVKGYKYDHTDCRTIVKDGISRDYTEIYYRKAA